ncbi:MAG: cytochrome c3 family protein [Planctomycetota bacterium]
MMLARQFCVFLTVSSVFVSTYIVGAAERPTTPQSTCVTDECHAGHAQKPHVHAPVSLGQCDSCHKPADAARHTFEFVRKGRDLCEYCHLEQTAKEHVHEPLKEGDCMQCHDAHSSENKFLLTEKTTAALCQNCHQTGKGLKFLHGPVAVGQCTICHQSHSADHESLLTVAPEELCFSCHVVTKDELEKFEFVHEPAKGNCVGCHDGHGANNAMMLKAEAPQLCYSCHEQIQQASQSSQFKHSVVTEQGGCLHCHTPHASTVRRGLKDDPMSLCLSCHNKPVGVAKDEVIPAFSEQIEGKKFAHGPINEKDCSGCHSVHGSGHFRLLAMEYPPIFYAPFSEQNYELCFSCHAKTLVWTPKTTDLTDFRNGSSNLHFLHVHKERRGRTCRACHQTHASDQPKHIRQSVPYGMWELPVGFTKTETGGSCKPGCHLPKGYDRVKPVDYSVPLANPPVESVESGDNEGQQDRES